MQLILILVVHSCFLVEEGVICGKINQKVKQSLYRPWQTLRFPGGQVSQISLQSEHASGKFVSPMHRPSLSPGNIPGTHFCLRLRRPQDHSATGSIMSTKNSNNSIRNRTRDLPACSAVICDKIGYEIPSNSVLSDYCWLLGYEAV